MYITREIAYKIAEKLPHNLRDNIRAFKQFNFKGRKHPESQTLIAVIDGSSFHGGLGDRLKGIISLFHFCLCRNIPFRIHHTFPFELSDYFIPNEYNWKLSDSDRMTRHFFEARLINLVADPSAARLVNLKTKKQIHAYANRDIVSELNKIYGTDYSWGKLFKQLFRPAEELDDTLKRYKNEIGRKYISAVFRFQNLLGDFKEYDYVPLADTEKETLIQKCKKSLFELATKSDCRPILVTSDSNCFLEAVSGMDNIYSFPRKNVHMDTVTGERHDVYMKSFIDFYLLSDSMKIYSVGTERMYKTEFPLYASKVNDIPFERILI
ncbi:MAG: hypothetical protein LBH80_04370 [Prevotellaceae bacterium]|jgi:hypothetical protein|nr:hypothetical protein [Prevotellaceae bacterium]